MFYTGIFAALKGKGRSPRIAVWEGCACALFAVAFVFSIFARRVEFLDEGGAVVLSFPLYLGESFSTEYIHSVQLCPVVDEYYAVGNFLWLWEERTQSTNAGLPTEAPRLGRFVHDPPWYRYIGGRRAFKALNLRVGDARTGRNVLTLPTGEKVDLFERFTGALLTMRLR
ncbi:MAG: DUF1850 domain-containing protein [Synergistaceae bacterium]|jgi:hypothetical protein|nr:DUF1850 domain-containing protein [Synergistaceae bacterium]